MALPKSNGQLVLITGVNGYIAARTAETFLNAGFSVRGTVRSKSSGTSLLAALKDYAEAGRFEIVEVKDITVPGAFDEAVKGCYAVAHMASPVSLFFDDPEPVIHTAVQGTLSVLNSAFSQGSSTLKSFVFMSSIAAVFNNKAAPYVYTEKDWNNVSEDLVASLGKKAPGPQIYSASKAAAEKAFWKFRDEKKPSFSMSAVNPTFVAGPPLTFPDDPAMIGETTRSVYIILSGQPFPPPLSGSGAFVDVRDVADLMLYGVEKHEIANGERYIACGGVASEQAISDILREKYTDRKIEVGEPGTGYQPGWGFKEGGIVVDGSKGKKALGREWAKYDKVVLDTAKAYERYL